MSGDWSGDDNGRMNWRRNTGYNRRIIRCLVQVRGSEDLNWGHEIMGCVSWKGWRVWQQSFLGPSKQDNGDGSIAKRAQGYRWLRREGWYINDFMVFRENNSLVNFIPPPQTKLTLTLWYTTHRPTQDPMATHHQPHHGRQWWLDRGYQPLDKPSHPASPSLFILQIR